MAKKTILMCDRCHTTQHFAYISDEITFGGKYTLSITKYDPKTATTQKLDLCLNCFEQILNMPRSMSPRRSMSCL